MSRGNAAEAPPTSQAPGGSPGEGETNPLVAVVWSRQVDNEAESPGYTTLPGDFPGRRETLEQVRFVGNLAINASDTQDYWDPDPASKLAFYNNLFLYPGYSGRYLCLGRMFLSTEDRPRLGMKTLVLTASEILRRGGAGGAIRRWYLSMGNLPRGSLNATPEPRLMEILSQAFGFPGDPIPSPRLLLVSSNWNETLESLLTLLERIPSSMVALAGIFAIPYYLSVAQVNLNDFTGRFPLTLGVLRVPPAESMGERHQKRVASWTAAGLRVLDLTPGSRALTAPSHPDVPVSWWVSEDPPLETIQALRQEIDETEIPRYLESSSDPEFRRGPVRRGELARIFRTSEERARVLQGKSPSGGGPEPEFARSPNPRPVHVPPPPDDSGTPVPIPALGTEPGPGPVEVPEALELPRELLGRLDEEIHRRIEEVFSERLSGTPPTDLAPPTRQAVVDLVGDELGRRLDSIPTTPALRAEVRASVEEIFRDRVEKTLAAERAYLRERLEALLQEVQAYRGDTEAMDRAVRDEVRMVDEKVQLLTEKVIPILKRTWVRIGEIQQGAAGRESPASDAKLRKLREELWGEMKRLELDIADRTKAILDRVEGNLQSQGRIWLALVSHLSQLTEERQELLRQVGAERSVWSDENSPPGRARR